MYLPTPRDDYCRARGALLHRRLIEQGVDARTTVQTLAAQSGDSATVELPQLGSRRAMLREDPARTASNSPDSRRRERISALPSTVHRNEGIVGVLEAAPRPRARKQRIQGACGVAALDSLVSPQRSARSPQHVRSRGVRHTRAAPRQPPYGRFDGARRQPPLWLRFGRQSIVRLAFRRLLRMRSPAHPRPGRNYEHADFLARPS